MKSYKWGKPHYGNFRLKMDQALKKAEGTSSLCFLLKSDQEPDTKIHDKTKFRKTAKVLYCHEFWYLSGSWSLLNRLEVPSER